MHYRPDIDGLRALAVAAVVLFHVGLGPVPGGFVGVDIFFVISGYLITGLIVDHLRRGEFSFWDFYARRTRRIYPALFVLIPAVLIAGYFLLTPGEYKDLGESAVYSSAFLANVYFLLNTGYFDRQAETMPLLHLWSIGIEEQFYLIWPLTLVLVWRFVKLGRNATLIALIGVTVLLAGVCIVWTAYDMKSAFYLPFTRLWEFSLGALLLAVPEIRRAWLADLLSGAGMVAMVWAAFAFNDALAYPGYYAILPCLGAAAIMAAGERSLVNRVLSLRPNVLLGKVSYSLYLWHWPILVFYILVVGRNISAGEKISLVLAAVAIAFVSWHFVEQPARRRRYRPRRLVAYGATLAASTAAVALLVVVNAGFPNRLPEELRALGDHNTMMAFNCTEKRTLPGAGEAEHCIVGAPWASASKRAVIWGDSHAHHLLPLLDVSAREQNLSVAYWGGCAPFIYKDSVQREKRNNPRYAERCARPRREILEWLGKDPDIDLVIISNAWARPLRYPFYNDGIDVAGPIARIEQGLVETFAKTALRRYPVLLIGDVPRPGYPVPSCVLRSAFWRKPCRKFAEVFTNPERPVEAILARVASESRNVHYLDATKAMCVDPEGCSIRVGDEIIYRDKHHLRHDLRLDTRQEIVSRLRLGEVLEAAIRDSRKVKRQRAPKSDPGAPG